MSKAIKQTSAINYGYATIKIGESRLAKGLLAFPRGLSSWFPSENRDIQVYLSDSVESQIKRYSSYTGSTRECRIGGLREWFEKNGITAADEIVVQFLDSEKFVYRLIPEKNFISTTRKLQREFDGAKTEEQAFVQAMAIADWTRSDESAVSLNEFARLASISVQEERHHVERANVRARESVPANLRTLLLRLYAGHCQLCDFWFLKRDNEPYFEVHHLEPDGGITPRMLLSFVETVIINLSTLKHSGNIATTNG